MRLPPPDFCGSFRSLGRRLLLAFLTLLALLCLCGCPNGSANKDSLVRFVYVANEGSDNVSMFQVKNDNGETKYFGQVPAGHQPIALQAVSVTDSDKRLVVANSGDDTLSYYQILESGALRLTATVPTGNRPVSIAIPNDGFVDVLCQGSGEVVQYRIDGDALTESARANVGSAPAKVTFDRASGSDTTYILVSNSLNDNVSVFAEPPTGGLTPSNPVAVGANPTDLVPFIGENAAQVFVLNSTVPSISLLKADTDGYHVLRTDPFDARSHSLRLLGLGTSSTPYLIVGLNDATKSFSVYNVTTAGVVTKVSGTLNSTGADVATDLQSISYSYYFVTNLDTKLRVYTGGTGSPALLQTLETNGVAPVAIAITEQSYKQPLVNPLSIKNDLANGTVGTPYSSTLTTEGGRVGIVDAYSVESGTLPPGLTLHPNPDGTVTLSGTPVEAGTYTFTIKATEVEVDASKTFTVVIGDGGSTGSGITGKFFNLDPTAGHDPLSLKINGTNFPNTAFGAMSAALDVTPSNAAAYEIDNGSGTSIFTGSVFLSSTGTKFFFVMNELGLNAGTFPGGYPAAGNGGITFVQGADISSVTIDIRAHGSTTVLAHDSLAFAGISYQQVPPGSYDLTVSNSSGTVIATASNFTVSADKIELVGTTSDDNGANPRIFTFAYN